LRLFRASAVEIVVGHEQALQQEHRRAFAALESQQEACTKSNGKDRDLKA
jgi:hypothetical protein